MTKAQGPMVKVPRMIYIERGSMLFFLLQPEKEEGDDGNVSVAKPRFFGFLCSSLLAAGEGYTKGRGTCVSTYKESNHPSLERRQLRRKKGVPRHADRTRDSVSAPLSRRAFVSSLPFGVCLLEQGRGSHEQTTGRPNR
jgi:hypothetical protein